MSASILVIGGGGREHAIVWSLNKSDSVEKIFVAPGSSGIEAVSPGKVKNISLDLKNFQSIAQWCLENKIQLVIVGPEDPLANGIADVLSEKNINVFGPKKNAARIESDKNWAKAFMDRHGIPTARWKSFTDPQLAKDFINNAPFEALVVKASGLAAGKGVVVASDKTEACAAVDSILTDKKYGNAGETIIIEELLRGEEVSLLAFSDGLSIHPMPPCQDHKRLLPGDAGPNTGGMGCYCPHPLATLSQAHTILQRVIDGLRAEGSPFTGVLYAGLMIEGDEIRVLEFNARFGDPETEVLLPLLQGDLYRVMMACCEGKLGEIRVEWRKGVVAVGVVMATSGYPEKGGKGDLITGIDKIHGVKNQLVFHCGTAVNSTGDLVTNGGRVLINVSLAPVLIEAAVRATRACEVVKFNGSQYRTDIGHKGLARSILQLGELSYKASGVDITAGNDLVTHIKPSAKSTHRKGVVGDLGGFGGVFDLKEAGYTSPLLISGTDGVGTKLKIAQEMNMHDTIGIDLVAMCVNDILAHGAEPLFFLDYFACGVLNVEVASKVIKGVSEGCLQANCVLVGGETAEMPDVYPTGEYDLAGFTVGAVERSAVLPQLAAITAGDVVIGLPSSGVHSNGFSLVRRVMSMTGVKYTDKAPFSTTGKTFGEELLTPTKIYVKSLLKVMRSHYNDVRAFAHITGGGLTENIPRVLPAEFSVSLDANCWEIPQVFAWLASNGGINEAELLRTFNCGLGGILIVSKEVYATIETSLSDLNARKVGEVCLRAKSDSSQVIVNNFSNQMDKLMQPFLTTLLNRKITIKKRRVAVLISGNGSNLQALIDNIADSRNQINAEIVLVISNKKKALGIERAKKSNIPTMIIEHGKFDDRESFDNEIHKALTNYDVELVCLAGFMRILSENFIENWRGRLINIHPALLPLFKGTNSAKQALDAGVLVTGCTVHFVEVEVDAGAILVQESVPVEFNDTVETLTNRIHIAEHKAYPKAMKLLANDKVTLGSNGKVHWNHS